jgi:hypothetical protein
MHLYAKIVSIVPFLRFDNAYRQLCPLHTQKYCSDRLYHGTCTVVITGLFNILGLEGQCFAWQVWVLYRVLGCKLQTRRELC